ncbi:MAG: DUF2298 domain-containing protein, partial [Chloroflexales bacterium]
PRRPALILAALAGLLSAWLWAARPDLARGPLLDLQTFLSTPQIWIWWLLAQLSGLIAWPLAARMLPGLPMAGYPMAKLLGLLLVAWLAWVLAICGIMPFGLPLVLIAALLVAAAAWLPPRARPRKMGVSPGILAYELLFLGGLFVGAWIRWHGAVGPAITGTEKPMEIAIINAMLRYDRFPPLDPWLAGFSLNYYYMGYVIVAGLALLSGAPSAVAFNLGFALVIALTIVGVAYAAHALVALSTDPAGRRPGRSAKVGVALLSLLTCLVLGSQFSALQLIVGSPLVRALDAGQLVEAIAQRLSGADVIRLSRPVLPSWDGPSFTTITPEIGHSFDWFMSSRTIYDDVALPDGGLERRYAINEFPAFTFYLGDLHTHVLALPVDLLALAAALAFVASPRQGFAQLTLAGIVIGCLYCVNTWHAPTYSLLAAAALALAARRLPPARRWPGYLTALATLAAATLLTALPFLLTFRPPAGRTGGGTLGLAPSHTQLHSFLIIYGLSLTLALTLLRTGQPGRIAGRSVNMLLVLLFCAIPLGALIGFPLLFLLPLAILLATRAWDQSASLGESLVAVVASVGYLILLVPELVYARDYMEGTMSRLNTIYKFYYQAWLLLGVVAAYAAWAGLRRSSRGWRTWLWAPPAALLLAGALVYPVSLLIWATPWRSAERSLDGLAFLARERPTELAAARWMAEHVAPADVVLTGFCYGCDNEQASRAAAISGVQTLLGWMEDHELSWRSGSPAQLAEIAARERDIPAIYAARDMAAARALLDRYRVRYVYLGPVERRLYGESAAAFARALPVAFRQGDITIYRAP